MEKTKILYKNKKISASSFKESCWYVLVDKKHGLRKVQRMFSVNTQ